MLGQKLKYLFFKIKSFNNRLIGKNIKQALSTINDPIPCFIVCYNNHSYVKRMVEQLNSKGLTPIILDNNSHSAVTRDFLSKIHMNGARVVYVGKNLRHKIGFLPGIYEWMPEVFAYTDPDLLFDAKLPTNFLNVLRDLTVEYSVFKAGMALSIIHEELDLDLAILKRYYSSIYLDEKLTVADWESQFWRFRLLRDDDLIIYAAAVDTTFAVYNKKNYHGSFMDAVRVAGNYSAIHVPWYPNLNNMTREEHAAFYTKNKSSTWVKK